MADKFRDCFVGEKGYDALKKLTRANNDLSVEFAKALQERSEAEQLYVRALRKFADTTQKLSGRTKGSTSQALSIIGSQSDRECDAHISLANTLLTDISIPLKNLAEEQAKERKTIEETINEKLKNWKEKKDVDNKYRTRQFEKSKEIETSYMKASEVSKSGKSSTKDSSKGGLLSKPSVMTCGLPVGHRSSTSEKPMSDVNGKCQANIESTLKKCEDELEKIERKYHSATRDVELSRQLFDAELCRNCDRVETMEMNRMANMDQFIQHYGQSMERFSITMDQVGKEICQIRIAPEEDIVTQAKSNLQTTETEILLYDIYAETDRNPMSDQRRILSLMKWMELLRKDIDLQHQSQNSNLFSRTLASTLGKSRADDARDDDISLSGDGAMRSASSHPKKAEASSSSSNDDDGAMRHTKGKSREKKEGHGFSNEMYINRQSVQLFLNLYEASLYKIEKVYNGLKGLREPTYEHAERFAKSYNDKGCPTSVLRITFQPLTHTPPSAPTIARCFAAAMPIVPPPTLHSVSHSGGAPRQTPQIGWQVDHHPSARAMPVQQTSPAYFVFPPGKAAHNQTAYTGSNYPIQMSAPPVSQQPKPVLTVRYPYTAKRKDELTIRPGDLLVLLERREDGWCRGILDGKEGVFPGNYASEE